MRQGVLLVAAMTFAFGLDYLFNLVAGQMLPPDEFGIIVALAGAGQVMVVLSRVVQTVVTRYVSGFQATASITGQVRSYFHSAFRIGILGGVVLLVIFGLSSAPLARFWQIPDVAPVLTLAATGLLMTTRPVVGGVLQGLQRFAALGAVQVAQAVLRLGLGVLMIAAGLGAFGGMLALPIASLAALILGMYLLREYVRPGDRVEHGVRFVGVARYSTVTLLGLMGYALLVNMDAILVKRFFPPLDAGYYGVAVTLGKIVQFFPLAIIIVLFPKAAQRRATQRDPAAVLLPGMVIVGLFCGAVTLAYALFPQLLIRVTFGDAYRLDGAVLALQGLAMTLFSLVNVWLNYFLSIDEGRYVWLLWLGVLAQAALMMVRHDTLLQLPAAMTGVALGLFVAGAAVFVLGRRERSAD